MNNLTSGLTGSFHLFVSILAMITGVMVLCMQKATKTHKQIGYVYMVAMVLVNLTAFMIYRLFWGVWHFSFFRNRKPIDLICRYVPHFKAHREELYS